MSSFVYNDGNFEIERPGEVFLTVGMFFDGTKNNRYHTEIRKKKEGIGEFRKRDKEEIEAMPDEDKQLYEQTKRPDSELGLTEEEKKMLQKYGGEESFGNDFTNVVRKYYACEKEYRIYTEGIGTASPEDKDQSDSMGGFVWGRGVTGIIEKVRSGCADLAKKISKKVEEKKKKNPTSKITLIIDVYGFSRGAAAARYFLYQLQKEAYPFGWTNFKSNTDEFDKYSKQFKIDENGYLIEDNWLKEGLLPPLGILGIELLKADVPRELIDTIFVKVRFLGIYDTVASYDPDCIVIPDFEGQIGKLHLHEIGDPQRAVHYTAINEHRENFSLTRLKTEGFGDKRVERNFPGVHSDVGGSYNHDPLDEDTFYKQAKEGKLYNREKYPYTKNTCEYEIVSLREDLFFFINLTGFRKTLIKESWFNEDQIEVRYRWIPNFFKRKLMGERRLEGGYSFIPLHFMCEEAKKFVPELNESKVLLDYPINDLFLVGVKAHLRRHTIEGGKNWVITKPSQIYSSVPHQEERVTPYTNEEEEVKPTEEKSINGGELKEVEVLSPNAMLRRLRNRYLHWSAKLNTISDELGFAPAKDRKRHEF